MTWCKLGGNLKNLSLPFVKHARTSFSDIMLENGTLYFVTLSVLNSLHLIFSVTSIFVEGIGTGGGSELTIFTNPLTAVFVYHFILDLQEANEHNVKIGSNDPELQTSQIGSQSSLSFVDRALGSLGSTITRGAAAVDNDYDDDSRDEDRQPSESDSGGVADHTIALVNAKVKAEEPEPDSEIQEVLRDEPLAREVRRTRRERRGTGHGDAGRGS
ncbi:hypothetical protein C8Q80DRAFT_772482 [Daedaleopsis nitida]|nr:hypothetical protein C8Q80DRAFT_772482 [Daedaleopsis nitida]